MQARPTPLDSLSTTGRPQEIVLVGASLAHLEFMAQLRAKPLTQARVTLVSPDTQMLPDNRLADILSGDAELEACHIGLQDLALACGVTWPAWISRRSESHWRAGVTCALIGSP